MSGSGEKDHRQKSVFDKVLAKHDEAINIQMEQNSFNDKLDDFKEAVKCIFNVVPELLSDCEGTMEIMTETKYLLDFAKKLSVAALEDGKAAHEIQAEKQKEILAARDAEYEENVTKLAKLKEECDYQQNILNKKEDAVAKCVKEIKVETSLFENKKNTLSALMRASGQQPKQLKIAEDHKAFQIEATKLCDLISSIQAENDNIRKRNAIMSEELDALENERQPNFKEVAKLQAIVDDNNAIYEREERKNQKLEKKFQSTRQRKMDDIARMEQEMVERRTAYESLKQINDNLRALNQKELGDTMSFEENMSKARAMLNQSNLDCAKLNVSIDAAKNEKVRRENEFKQLSEIKNQIILNGFQINDPENMSHVSQASSRDLMPPPNRHIDVDRGQLPRQPMTTGGSMGPAKKQKKSRSLQQAPTEQNNLGTTIRVADSSISGTRAETSDIPEDYIAGVGRRHANAIAIFKQFLS